MGTPQLESFYVSRADRRRLDRVVVLVGATVSWVVAAVYLSVAWITRDPEVLGIGLGPVCAAALMTAQIATRKEDASVALVGSTLIIVAWYALFPGEIALVAASVALVLVTTLSVLFVGDRAVLKIGLWVVALFAAPWLWQLSTSDRLLLGATLSGIFLAMASIIRVAVEGSRRLGDRYQRLFEESPSPLIEEDWADSLAYLRGEYSGRPERIGDFLRSYPAVVKEAIGRARVVRVNGAALRLLGIEDGGRFVGSRRPGVMGQEMLTAYVGALAAMYAGESTWEDEVLTRSADGSEMWLHIHAAEASIRGDFTSVMVGLSDITHIKQRNLAMADLMKSKDEFIATVSHELRTPLTAVIGLTSEMVNMDADLGQDDRAELLHLVAGQASEMSNIVEDLLVAVRADAGTVVVEMSPVDLVDEAAATLDGLAASATLPSRRPPPVLADSRRVRQILRNLITNATRYGGPRISISAAHASDRAWIEVRDNGAGITADRLESIFDPYVTGSTAVHGSVGLGLAVARRLAEAMNGTLEYERVGGESVFRLELELAPDPVALSPGADT